MSAEVHTVSLSPPPPPPPPQAMAVDSSHHVDHLNSLTQVPMQAAGFWQAHFEDDLDSSDGEFPELLPSLSPSMLSHAGAPPRQAPTPRERAENPHISPQIPSHGPLPVSQRLLRTPGTPRRLSHAGAGLGKKGCHTARDVWSFFLKTESAHQCAFCMYVSDALSL